MCQKLGLPNRKYAISACFFIHYLLTLRQMEFISTVCHLLFIGSDSQRFFDEDPRGMLILNSFCIFSILILFKFTGPPHGVLNVEVFQKIFLRVFAAGTTEDMKTELLKTIRAIFNIGTSRYCFSSSLFPLCNFLMFESQFEFSFDGFTFLAHLSPFKTLFFQFDSLSINNRRMVLAMMDEVLPSHGSLRNDEMQAYCYLLLFTARYFSSPLFSSYSFSVFLLFQDSNSILGKRPSTLLLITQHMTALLAEHRLSSDRLKEVGLVPVLIDYLVHPHELACRSMLVDPAELSLSASLLPHTYLSIFHTLEFFLISQDILLQRHSLLNRKKIQT
jgi:hypothetical protein